MPFKVVSNVDGKYYSAVFCGYKDMKKRYIPNEFVSTDPVAESLGYGLTYFSNVEDAIDFKAANCYVSNDDGILEIWEIKVKNIFKELPLVRIVGWGYVRGLLVFKSKIEHLKLGKCLQDKSEYWPKGTKMASEIMLVKKVSN